MYSQEEEDNTVYQVLVNHEEQYSLWPEWKEIPGGWKATGKVGSKQECMDYVDEVWTDMTPLSLRKQMAEHKQKQAANKPNQIESKPAAADSKPIKPTRKKKKVESKAN